MAPKERLPMQNKPRRWATGLLVAVVLILAAGFAGYAIGNARQTPPVRAYNLTTGQFHNVRNPDCNPSNADYTGEAVCSWVNAFLEGRH